MKRKIAIACILALTLTGCGNINLSMNADSTKAASQDDTDANDDNKSSDNSSDEKTDNTDKEDETKEEAETSEETEDKAEEEAEEEIINALNSYDNLINGDETFTNLYSLEEETFEEFCESISEAGEPEIKRVTYVDLDGQNGKELILDLGTNAGVYLILSHIDGKYYGNMTTTRCFEELQNNGTYRGSGGAGDSYYMRATISTESYTEEYIAEYHDGVFTVDGEEVDDYEGWLSENFSDPAYWWEKN
ncbi:MAG: hypothetical protein K6G87_00055 [Butyrivibrio sp.]|uniref:hypothetical protein n=1 Tax=Butyrivibrio sp. TaxID=28121 RepID=UPI0025E43981|nr:hypothetical protein [Butyrivibrio sp.]MCR5769601.1 hypothetical protein [Butyrivibrio sp.]